MPRDTLTGLRIRERRVAAGLKQADLARQAGISASYLNLIEHNRRRIGGKLLNRIAEILRVEPVQLSEGAGEALIAALREAAAARTDIAAELARADEFAGRFPGWARLLAETRARVVSLERTVETLTDRMTHDPHLAASLHEMLSTVTAIRSAAAILAEPGEIAPEWQARFHRNINEDSKRLAETSRTLVAYLEADGETVSETGSPQEEADAAWDRLGHHVPALEAGGTVAGVLAGLGGDLSGGAAAMLERQLSRYRADAAALPADRLRRALDRHGPEVAALSAALDAGPDLVMRRLAALPPDVMAEPVGLVVCDASGVPVYRKPHGDFPMPRVGAGCPLWPLYRALSRPLVLIAGPVRAAGGEGRPLWAEAVAVPAGPVAVNRDPVFGAQMLLRAPPRDRDVSDEALAVGSACRVCPRAHCPARREPSILSDAANTAAGGF